MFVPLKPESPMNPRLAELQQQRARVSQTLASLAQHLAWLDQQIAEAGHSAQPTAEAEVESIEPPAPLYVQAQPAPVGAEPPVMAPAAADEDELAEEILSQYREPSGNPAATAKRSAFVAFALFMTLLVGAMAAFYFYEKAKLGR